MNKEVRSVRRSGIISMVSDDEIEPGDEILDAKGVWVRVAVVADLATLEQLPIGNHLVRSMSRYYRVERMENGDIKLFLLRSPISEPGERCPASHPALQRKFQRVNLEPVH